MYGAEYPHRVTPYVGVWIETKVGPGLYNTVSSLLMWECGLKLLPFFLILPDLQVTPYVGVWIETQYELINADHISVTPYVGVWIETV